jgi:hypothetical protein
MADFDEKSDEAGLSIDGSQPKEWAAIRAPDSLLSANRTGVGGKSPSLNSIGRTRSQNGYGCDEGNEQDDDVDVEAYRVDKDPFEVGWENGDDDPLNPRSWKTARKWVIVLICSMSSTCV